MFLSKIVKKLIWSAVGFVIVAIIALVGYFFTDDEENDIDNIKRNFEEQQTNNDFENDINNQTNNEIMFKPLFHLPPSSELPLQQHSDGTYKEGIYYFTSRNPANLTIDPGHNAWLIQLRSKLGKRIEVERIEKSGNNFDIYVNLHVVNTAEFALKPSYGFFQAKEDDMPIYGKFRIYDVDNPGQPIWP